MTSPPTNLDPHDSPVDRSVRGLMSDFETREELEKQMDELARRYAETHDEELKAEIEALTLRLANRWNPQ